MLDSLPKRPVVIIIDQMTTTKEIVPDDFPEHIIDINVNIAEKLMFKKIEIINKSINLLVGMVILYLSIRLVITIVMI